MEELESRYVYRCVYFKKDGWCFEILHKKRRSKKIEGRTGLKSRGGLVG